MNQICEKLFGIEMLEDIRRYKQIRNKGLLSLFLMYPEFRYQVLYRLRLRSSFLKYILMPLRIHNPHCLWISCKNIGGGFFIEHGFSTVIACQHIGKNCWVNQQVTIGYSDSNHCPYIGDNVEIYAGAKVIGGITIGDDVIIGANAVVVKDVPSHSIVAGVPAKIIKKRSDMKSSWEKV